VDCFHRVAYEKLKASFHNITMATIITLSHKAQNSSTANDDHTMAMVITRGIFVMEHTGMPFLKFFLRRTQTAMVFQNFYPGIVITNTSSSPTKFWVTLCVSEPIFFRKIALVIKHTFININATT
jgi:hypothetical protein